jgi:heme/copper-type cytochrome/quinol oxidase subunit 2
VARGGPATAGRAGSGRRIALILIIAVAASVFVVFAIYTYGSGTPQEVGAPSLMNATCSSLSNMSASSVEHVAYGGSGGHAYFLIVAADPPSPFAGYNGSYYQGTSTQWPTMNVNVGQVVSIHVINCASSEAHGFAITYYDDKSIIAIPRGSYYDVTFTATKAGSFRVYCDIFCAIHPFMQNGALVVS